MLQRNSLIKLQQWQQSNQRKPLIIRGARQVGKTTLVHLFAREFDNFIELNLEKSSDRKLFETDDIGRILQAIYLIKNISPRPGTTLLFMDEIQESPEAIKLLRYFHEEYPDIHVIAAGSLLEFALAKVPSFPVGRVEYLYLHPLNFDEYLQAIGHHQALEAFHQVPIPAYSHDTLIKCFHDYALLGGMPEILSNYLKTKNIVGLNKTYQQLWTSYKDDVEKYARNHTEKTVIRHVINTAPFEDDRIRFENFGNSNYRSREVGEALRALDLAKIIRLIYPTTSVQPPVSTDFKKRPRLQFLDTGMLNQILLLQKELITINDLNEFHKGRTIQHLIYQELISVQNDTDFVPNFWVREQKTANSEVDLVYSLDEYVIPIEIKSGKQGTLRSLHQFVEKANHPYALRLYAGEYSVERHETPGKRKPYLLMNIPYYLGTKIPEYISHFINNY